MQILVRALCAVRKIRGAVVVQGFDEISILPAMLICNLLNYPVIAVMTNNVSPERLRRAPLVLPFLLRVIGSVATRLIYHTDYERALLILSLIHI